MMDSYRLAQTVIDALKIHYYRNDKEEKEGTSNG